MKSTGIVRKLDELGRITLPIELRRTLGIEENERAPLEIFTEDDTICLKRVPKAVCMDCGSTKDLVEKDGKHLCRWCLEGFKEEAAK